MAEGTRRALVGAAFLMATSAIGPGFLTQTAVFTERLRASFAFAILVSVLFDLAAQLNVWRVLAVTGRRADAVAEAVLPGLGRLLAALVVLGGLAFNIGNVAGAGLGLQVLTGLPVRTGATLSAALAVGLFLLPQATAAMDRFAIALGFLMIGLTGFVALSTSPPIVAAVVRAVVPLEVDPLSVVTIVGGTVGGYITFAGAHRLLDAGVRGVEAVPAVDRSATMAIGAASAMRVLLFLAVLGVVQHGVTLAPDNPAASAFGVALGEGGRRLFGLVMWAAAITSVVGAAYTSVSFLRGWSAAVDRRWTWTVVGFIVVSTVLFLLVGRPVTVLVLVGAINGLILPLSLLVVLVASRRAALVGRYRHPAWLAGAGWMTAAAMTALGVRTLITELGRWMR